MILQPERWTRDAACRHHIDPDTWLPSSLVSTHARAAAEREAKTICNTCPVASECHAYAETNRERHGIWAGLNRGRGTA